MSYKEIMDGKNRAVLDSAIATKILQHMDRVRNFSHEGQDRRWVWELIQNAKDCAYPGQGVSVKIELFPDSLRFSHNGKPFDVKSLLSIVNQVSSKVPENLETTGKFGTGFVTTHLLSEKVHLTSIIQDFDLETGARLPMKHFSMELDRSGTTQEEILAAVERAVKAVDSLDESPHAYVDLEEFNTVFTYDLSSAQSQRVAQVGLSDLEFSAGYVLAFVPNISEISVIDHVHSVRKEMKRGQEKIWGDSNVSTFTLLMRENGVARHEYLLLARHQKTVLAMPLDAEGGKLLEISSKTPRIFSDFPLIGSENFPFPVVCHDSGFRPDEVRSFIPVVDSAQSLDSQVNQEILRHGMLLYKELLIVVTGAGYESFFHAVTFPAIPNRSDLDSGWVQREILERIHYYLREIPLIPTEKGLVALHDKFFIPVSSDYEEMSSLWEILTQVQGIDVPVLAEALGWCKAFLRYTEFMQKYSIALQTLGENASQWELKEGCSPLGFIQMIFNAVMKHPILRREVISGNLAIFPDQTKEMKLHTCREIYRDPDLDEGVKRAIMEVNQIDWFVDNEKFMIYELLLHQSFELGDLELVPVAPVEKYFQYIGDKCDVSARAMGFVRENPDNQLHRIRAAGYMLSCYHDPMWLDVYRKCIDPSFEVVYCPSLSSQVMYWEKTIMLVMFEVAKMLQQCLHLDKFKRGYFPEEEGHIDWLRGFMESSIKVSTGIYDFAIFPDQYGNFRSAYQLKNDGGIDPSLKDIACLLSGEGVQDFGKLVISKDFPPLTYVGVSDLGNEDIAREITKGINRAMNRGDLSVAEEETQEACTWLLAWLQEHPELGEDLFGQFFAMENRMKLLTPHSAVFLHRRVAAYGKLLSAHGIANLSELSVILDKVAEKGLLEQVAPSHILEDEDIYVDFHEHPSLYDFGRREREEYSRKLRKTAEQFAMNRLILKWETIGYEQVHTAESSVVALHYLDQEVLLSLSGEKQKECGWAIAEVVSGKEPVYYEVKSSVSAQKKDSIDLTHAQADCAFTLGERYCIFRFLLAPDLQSVISCTQISHLVEELKEKQLFFTGAKLSLWLRD